MKVIGLVGVSGSGKTTLMTALNEVHGLLPVHEVTRGEIFTYINRPIVDIKKASTSQLYLFDVGRVEYQIIQERKWAQTNYLTVVDKSVLNLLYYVLTYQSRYASADVLTSLVQSVLNHINSTYMTLAYLPYQEYSIEKGLNRNVTNNYALTVQDASLREMLKWVTTKSVTLEGDSVQAKVERLINEIS